MRTFIVVILFLAAPPIAAAHDVALNWKLKNGVVAVQVFFDSNAPGANAAVTVRDANRSIVAEGKADADGRWSFPAPKPGTYEMRADAGLGHVATERMVIASADASGGTDRGVFTRFRWTKIVIGIATIGMLALAAMIAMRVKRQPGRDNNSTDE